MIKLIVLDVDGCMTDGKIIFDANGIESKSFNVKDGLGITTWRKINGKVAIITGRNSSIVEKRAQELGIDFLFQGIKNKKETLEKIVAKLDIGMEEVAAIGDDLNDLSMLKTVGKSFTPANGMEIIKRNVDVVLTKSGGEGAVREMIDIIVEKNGLSEEFYKVWL